MKNTLAKGRKLLKKLADKAAATRVGKQVMKIPAPIRNGYAAGLMVPVPGSAEVGALIGTGAWAKGKLENSVRKRTGQPYRVFHTPASDLIIELMETWDGKSGGSVSPKLDGVYARATKDGVFSKSGKPLDLPHVSNRLKRHFRKNPDSVLEGEVYRKGQGIEAIAGAVKTGGVAAKKLKLHVFPTDGKRPLPFGAVRRVAAKPAEDAAGVQKIFQKALKRGQEGVVIRDATGKATKLKPQQDAEWEVAKVHGGPRGVLALKQGDRTFKVQSKPGLTAKPGDRVQVRYSGTSKKGVPKAAVAIRVRNSNDFEIMNAHHSTPARLLLGDSFPFPVVRPYARVIHLRDATPGQVDLARGETTEEEIARDRAALKRIGIGSAAAGLGLATVIHKGRKAGGAPAVVPAAPVAAKKPAASYWGKKKRVARVKVRFSTPAVRMGIMGPMGLMGPINLEEKRDTLSKVRDGAIIAGTGAVGAGALITAGQARKLRKKADAALGYASSSVARGVREIRENVTPKSVAHEGLKLVKNKAKEKAVEYFPTFTRAAKALKKPVKFFQTPAQRLGLFELATATYDKSKVRDNDKRFVDHWKVASGMQKGFMPDGSEAKVGMADPAVLKSLYRKASTVNKWGTRGGGLVKDAADVVVGKPRARDASGRKKKREWEKGWAKDAVKKALIIGGGIGYGIAYKKSPRLRATQDQVTGAVRRTGDGIKDAISNLSTPAREILLEAELLNVLDFAKKEKRDNSAAVRTGIAGAAIGAANGAVLGTASAAGSKQADDYFAVLKKREARPAPGGLLIADRKSPAPFKAKGKFNGAERLARAEHNSLTNLKKTIRRRAAGGGLAGAAVLGGAGYLATRKSGDQKPQARGQKKRFSTPASRMGLIDFDTVAAEAGWDIRDPRGKSARVFAPGSRKRVRREKTWSEEIGNERKLWKGGLAIAGLAGGAAGIAIGKRLPKRPPGKAGVVVALLKKRRG